MSSEIKTYLIEDHRVSGITDEILVGVKKSVSTSNIQKYKQISNSTTSTLFNITVPSENTLVDRHIKISGTIQLRVKLLTQQAVVPIVCVPSSFPLNTALNNVVATINNTTVKCSSQDVSEIIKKQYSQRFLSQHVQTTPSYVDKYFGSVDQAAQDNKPGSYMSGILMAEKDSDTIGRADSKIKLSLVPDNSNVYYTVALTNVNGVLTLPATSGTQGVGVGTYYLNISLPVSEPILGLPCFELKSEEACFVGVNAMEINLLYNDFSRVFYVNEAMKTAMGNNKFEANGNFLDESCSVVVNYLSLHASDYAKMSVKNVIPYNEFVSYKTPLTRDGTAVANNFSISSNQVQLRQIPDKIYINVGPTFAAKPIAASNHLSFPIKNIKVSFNNRSNLLAELNQDDLYELSRRNGNHQAYSEFCGKVVDSANKSYIGLGSYLCLDPVRDLSLDDYLSSGSIGTFALQIDVECLPIDTSSAIGINFNNTVLPVQLNIVCSYGGVLITQQGSSATMSGLLTKVLVLESKDQGNAVGDFESVETVKGGNLGNGLTSFRNHLKKTGQMSSKLKALKEEVGGRYNLSGGTSKLSKYI